MANRNLKGDVNVQFEEPTSRINLDSGSSVKTLFGRISKWLKDLKAVAFSGSYTDLSDKPTIPPATAVKGNSETTYRTGNVNLTPANMGLGNVNNTSDANKPISTATQAALNGKVNKSGDTMTGTLTHQASRVYLKATNLDLNGDNPSTYTYGNSRVEFVDKDGQRSGFINAGRQIAGATQFSLAASARNTADTIDVYNQFDISVARDGTCSYKVTDPAAFRNAINVASKADIPLTIHIDYRNIDAHTCDSTYNECLSALESGRAVIAMIQITSKLMRTCFFGLDTDTKIICGEIPNGSTTYDFDWRAGEDCPSIGISS